MTEPRHGVPLYSTKRDRGGEFAGYGVQCHDMLTLYRHRDPFKTEADAKRIQAEIEKAGLCALDHKVVEVYKHSHGVKTGVSDA